MGPGFRRGDGQEIVAGGDAVLSGDAYGTGRIGRPGLMKAVD